MMKDPKTFHGKFERYLVARISLLLPLALSFFAIPMIGQHMWFVIPPGVLILCVSYLFYFSFYFVKTLTIHEDSLYIDTGRGRLTFEFDRIGYVHSSIFGLDVWIGRRVHYLAGIDPKELDDCKHAVNAAIWDHVHSE